MLRATAGWLWSGRRGIVAGFSAAALHGSKWVEVNRAVELVHHNRHRLPGIQIRGDRLEYDEIEVVDDIPVTSPARTALDLGCWYPTMTAVAAIDALARATDVKAADIEVLTQRYPGRRGIARARRAVGFFDAGAESPKESWLRVVLMKAGLPRPQTQIPVRGGFGEHRLSGHGLGGRQSRHRVRRRSTPQRSAAIHVGHPSTRDGRVPWVDRHPSRRGR